MEFMEVFTAVKEALAGVDPARLTPNFAVQVNITGEGEGAFYIANKSAFEVEPYDYRDRNGAVSLDGAVMLRILAGKLTAEQALAGGKINIQGDPSGLLSVFAAAKPTEEKPAPAPEASAPAKPKAPPKPKASAKPKTPAKPKAAAKAPAAKKAPAKKAPAKEA
jgi:hypothetical protein